MSKFEMTDFNPAFDMPSTAAQAVEMLRAWGNPTVHTFQPARAAKAAEILINALVPGGIHSEIAAELDRAVSKFPTWPTDPLHALAVLGEEFGELTKAMLQRTYEPHKGVTLEDIREEAIQTAAMAIRLVHSLGFYVYTAGPQHSQTEDTPEYRHACEQAAAKDAKA